jgi:uroporphyrinogen decarboxylase
LAGCSAEDLNAVTWPDPYDPARVEGLAAEARSLYETTDYAIVADIMCRGPFELAVKLRGFEQFLMDMSLDRRFAMALLDKITQTIIALWDVYLDAVGPYVQVVCQGDDMGMQTSLMFSPKMYRQLIKPCHRRIYDFVHAHTEAKVFMHSCGAIYDIIPDLIEVGVDALNPLQRDASKMEIGNLKREFGAEICFWGGGIDVQQALRAGDPDTIAAKIQRSIETLAPGGGYVFALTHNLQPDITPDRVDLAYRSALAHRDY